MRIVLVLLAVACMSVAPVLGDDYTFEKTAELPDDLPASLAEKVQPNGCKVVGPRRDLCAIWLLKDVAQKKDFSPSLAVKYPFTPGQLIGVIEVPRRSGLTDFKGQEIERGLYALRYGQQPMDGNHIGTSDTADFLLAVPMADDADPAPIADQVELFANSAEAAGTTHPAIFSLLPVESDSAEPGLTHDEDDEFWILQLVAPSGDKQVPLRMIVVGESKG
mgnify:CR=1 FL=1